MPIDYAALQNVATQMIENFGRSAILRLDDHHDLTVKAIVVDYGTRERDGSLIQARDRRAFVAVITGGVIPSVETHKLVIDAVSYRIVNVTPLAPGGTVLYFDCQVRA